MRGSISHILVSVALAAVFPSSVNAQGEKKSEVVPTSDFQVLARQFDYDSRRPLDYSDTVTQTKNGVTIHDLQYASPKNGRVTAYLVVPEGKGPFVPIVFGHWGPGNRTEFLPEALFYAKAGAISLLVDYPWVRPAPWRRGVPNFDKPELDREIYIQAVVDIRRGIDLLLARKDVDPKRLAYVGHSYGAQWGAILSAVDERIKTAVLIGGVAEEADILLRNQDPGLVELRKHAPPGQIERYVEVNAPLDAIHYVGHARAPLLFQFANYERYFDRASMEKYFQAASEPKQVSWYDTGHELNDLQALADRYRWLSEHVGLKARPLF